MEYTIDQLPSRLAKHIVIDEKTGCWNYTGYKAKNGYGLFTVSSKHTVLVHRYVYILFKGEPQFGQVSDHLCRNRSCCNPGHLEMVSSRENTIRGNGKSARGAASPRCWRCGSDYFTRADGTRICKPCLARASKAWHERNKG